MRPRGRWWWVLLASSVVLLVFIVGWIYSDPEPNSLRQVLNGVAWTGVLVAAGGLALAHDKRGWLKRRAYYVTLATLLGVSYLLLGVFDIRSPLLFGVCLAAIGGFLVVTESWRFYKNGMVRGSRWERLWGTLSWLRWIATGGFMLLGAVLVLLAR